MMPVFSALNTMYARHLVALIRIERLSFGFSDFQLRLIRSVAAASLPHNQVIRFAPLSRCPKNEDFRRKSQEAAQIRVRHLRSITLGAALEKAHVEMPLGLGWLIAHGSQTTGSERCQRPKALVFPMTIAGLPAQERELPFGGPYRVSLQIVESQSDMPPTCQDAFDHDKGQKSAIFGAPSPLVFLF